MKVNPNKLSLAGSGTVGVLYLACAIFTAIFPDAALQLVAWMFHIVDVKKLSGLVVSFGGALIGLIEVLIYSYVAFFLFGWFYNKLNRS